MRQKFVIYNQMRVHVIDLDEGNSDDGILTMKGKHVNDFPMEVVKGIRIVFGQNLNVKIIVVVAWNRASICKCIIQCKNILTFITC